MKRKVLLAASAAVLCALPSARPQMCFACVAKHMHSCCETHHHCGLRQSALPTQAPCILNAAVLREA